MKASVASERYQEELNVRFVVAENNWNNTLNALLTNGGIGKGIDDTGKGIKKNDINVM